MEVVQVKTEEIYNMLKDWWVGNNFQVVSPSILPNTTFICYNGNGEPTYAMCFYHTDSKLCWVGWQIKNPDKSISKEGCFEFLFKGVEEYAKQEGYHILFTTSNTPPVEKVLSESGFSIGDTDVNHYLKVII